MHILTHAPRGKVANVVCGCFGGSRSIAAVYIGDVCPDPAESGKWLGVSMLAMIISASLGDPTPGIAPAPIQPRWWTRQGR